MRKMNNKIYVYATLDCGSDVGETLFIYGKDKKEVLKVVFDVSARTNWHFNEKCSFEEMQQYMFSCPLADAINCDSEWPQIDVNNIITHYKFRKNYVKKWRE